MSLDPGTQLGPYRILSPLGAGGMGEVYRAHDAKLNRDVALKVLSEGFATEPDRLTRFRREAQVLAALNHPNIAQIHGFEEAASVQALVMELVEGPTLADRIAQAPVPLDEAMAMARQIAEALEAAHEQGIIHRDLKPANIKIRPDGTVKVLDFGLAKAMDPAGASSANAMNSPTLTAHATQLGIILGTAAYMAPEQAKGKAVDKRADIWAFGVVLYEMLTGRGLFISETIPETLAHVMTREVDVTTLPAGTPPHVRKLIARCLVKDPKRRLRDIGDARLMLDEQDGPQPITALPARPSTRARLFLPVVAALSMVAIAAIGFGARLYFRKAPEAAAVRFAILPPAGHTFQASSSAGVSAEPWPMLSPDGRRIAFVAANEAGRQQLWIRPLDSATAQLLPGTEDAVVPFWAPDSRFIGFFAQGKLKKVDTWGGKPQELCDSGDGIHGGTWSSDGTILFSGLGPGLFQTRAGGGAATAAAEPDKTRQEQSYGRPSFLPDGRHYLFVVRSSANNTRGIYVGALGSTEHSLLVNTVSEARYSPSGHLLYQREGVLMAHPFDATRRQLTGDPRVVAERVANSPNSGSAAFSISSTGILAYRATAPDEGRQMLWVDASGKAVGDPLPRGGILELSLSPDGRRIAYAQSEKTGADLWLYDTARRATSKLTLDPKAERSPLWMPDNGSLVYASNQSGPYDLYRTMVGSTSPPQLLLHSNDVKIPFSVSSDGGFVLFCVIGQTGGGDIWSLDLRNGNKATPLVQTASVESEPRFAPDGKWFAYTSDESGRPEIYVQSFPPSGRKWQISIQGGTEPHWRRDGKGLYYIDVAGMLHAVDVTLGASVDAGTPRTLFPVQSTANAPGAWNYDVAADGSRFLVSPDVASAKQREISVVLNWLATVR